MPTPTEVRLALKAAGFSPVALNGKRPLSDGWQNMLEAGDDVIRRMPGANTGMITTFTPTLDIDITDQAAADYVSDLIEYRFKDQGSILVRFGKSPKRAIPFRTNTPFPKIKIKFEGGHALEFLADGQQVVVDGIHPDTKEPYAWDEFTPWDIEREDLPELTEASAGELMDYLADALAVEFGLERLDAAKTCVSTGGCSPVLDQEMRFGNVHDAQVAQTASLLRQGMCVDEVVATVLAETQALQPEGWNWEREEAGIREQCYSFICKNPELSGTLPNDFRTPFDALIAQNVTPRFKYRRGTGWTLLGAYTPPPSGEEPAEHTPQPSKRRSRLVAWGDVVVSDEPEFFIDGVLPREGIGVIYGPPKTHKTFIVLDMGAHVARGQPYRGRAVQQAPVVYCAFEGQHGFAKRIEAYRRARLTNPRESVPLYVQPVRLNLNREVRDLIDTIRDSHVEPGLVVLDTLNRSLVGSESKDADMTMYLAAADEIRQTFSCLVLIIHHSGLEGGRPRGHTSLTGAADAQLAVLREGDISTVTVEYMKDGREGDTLHSRLEEVDVGHGKTSCVIAESEAPEPTKAPSKRGKVEDVMYEALANSGGLSADEWQRRAKATLTDLTRNDFWKGKKTLLDAARVVADASGVFRVS